MKQFGMFIINHWLLFLALIIILALLMMNFLKSRLLGFKEIKPTEVVQLINHNNAVVFDVRDDKEFSEGHILGAANIPLDAIEGRLDELEKYRSTPVIMSCRTGQQSARAAMIMHKRGFSEVYKLAGGINAWQSASMPITRS